jgi:hypoxanthine phosphoribosyltransferase
VSQGQGATYTAARIAKRVAALGKEISLAYQGRKLDVVVTMDRSFVFAADLIRELKVPVTLHFIREEVQDVEQDGQKRREVFFSNRSTMTTSDGRPLMKGRDVLLVDAVIESGITQDFLLRRIGESQPRSLRLAVLLDKVSKRRVALEPDYFGFQTASNEMWAGYGLATTNGTGRNGNNLVAVGGKKVKRTKQAARKRG